MLIVNGTQIKKVVANGVTVKKVIFNGAEVFTSSPSIISTSKFYTKTTFASQAEAAAFKSGVLSPSSNGLKAFFYFTGNKPAAGYPYSPNITASFNIRTQETAWSRSRSQLTNNVNDVTVAAKADNQPSCFFINYGITIDNADSSSVYSDSQSGVGGGAGLTFNPPSGLMEGALVVAFIATNGYSNGFPDGAAGFSMHDSQYISVSFDSAAFQGRGQLMTKNLSQSELNTPIAFPSLEVSFGNYSGGAAVQYMDGNYVIHLVFVNPA